MKRASIRAALLGVCIPVVLFSTNAHAAATAWINSNFFDLRPYYAHSMNGTSILYAGTYNIPPFVFSIEHEVYDRQTVLSGPASATSSSRTTTISTFVGAELSAAVTASSGGWVRHTESLSVRIGITNASSDDLLSAAFLMTYSPNDWSGGGARVDDATSEFARFFTMQDVPPISGPTEFHEDRRANSIGCGTDGLRIPTSSSWDFHYGPGGSSVSCSQGSPDSSLHDVMFYSFAAGETRYVDVLLEIELEARAVPAPGAVAWFPLACAGVLAVSLARQRRPGRAAAARRTIRA